MQGGDLCKQTPVERNNLQIRWFVQIYTQGAYVATKVQCHVDVVGCNMNATAEIQTGDSSG